MSNVNDFLFIGGNAANVEGNVAASYFIGNGAFLTGVTATSNYGNANVANYLASGTDGSNITTTGNVTATYLHGDGSNISNFPAGNTLVNGTSNVAVTFNGNISFAVAGTPAGNIGAGNNGPVSIGSGAGQYTQGLGAVAIGGAAGLNTQGGGAVAIGTSAGAGVQKQGAVAIGSAAGFTGQGSNAIAIGYQAGYSSQANSTIILNATGLQFSGVSGQQNSFYVTPVRNDTGNTTSALYYNTSTNEITYASAGGGGGTSIVNGTSNVSIPVADGNILFNVGGETAGYISNIGGVAIGQLAGQNTLVANTISIGYAAGGNSQNSGAIAIGAQAGDTTQGASAIAIGNAAGQTTQGPSAVAIGTLAGSSTQSDQAIALGFTAGQSSQGVAAIAIGTQSGVVSQRLGAIAIGALAGQTTQGQYSVAVGYNAGFLNQANNTIILNATGSAVNGVSGQGNSFYVDPVRNDTGNVTNAVYYNTTTKELTYGPAGAGGNYGNANVSAYLASGTNTADIITSGNIIGGNIGNVATFLYGDGSNITNLPAGNYSNANVSAYLDSGLDTANIITSGNVIGSNIGNATTYLWGDGSNISNISPNSNIIFNGTTSVSIPVTDGNILFAVSGNTAGHIRSDGTIAIGLLSGTGITAPNAIAIGTYAGGDNQNLNTIAIGTSAGNTNQNVAAIAIGFGAGATSQGAQTVAIGVSAGSNAQGQYSIAIGQSAGSTGQSNESVAIGHGAALVNQSNQGVAIGSAAARGGQGANSVALGAQAAYNNLSNNIITLNATGSQLNGVANQDNSFYVAPIRSDLGNTTTALYYNTSTNEITIAPAGAGSSYGNSNVSAYLADGTNTANIVTTGNISGNFYIGNGRFLTGIISSYGDANVEALLEGGTLSNNIITSGNITVFDATFNNNVTALDGFFGGNLSAVTAANSTSTTQVATTEFVQNAVIVAGNYGNANVAAYLASGTDSSNIITTANVNATAFNTAELALLGNAIYSAGNIFIDPYADGGGVGSVFVLGNLQVTGNLTAVDSNVVTIDSLLFEAANTAANPAAASGGGLAVGPFGTPYATWTFNAAANVWQSNLGIDAGNVTAPYFIGDGSQLTNLPSSIGNSITNGTSNVVIPVANGNIFFNINGNVAGNLTTNITSLGYQAGVGSGGSATNFGAFAGSQFQGSFATSIGVSAGFTGQQNNAVAVGYNSGYSSQNVGAVAIGGFAGRTSQGSNSIAIGYNAGFNSQAANTIILNATGAQLNGVAGQQGRIYIAPVRSDNVNVTNSVYYNPSTKELTYSAVTAGYGDAQVEALLASGTINTNIITTGNVNAGAFNGDGSGLYNIQLGSPSFVVETADFITNPGQAFAVDTSGGPINGQLGAFFNVGASNYFTDAAGTWGTNPLTITPVIGTIMGQASIVINTTNQSVGFWWNGSDWRMFT